LLKCLKHINQFKLNWNYVSDMQFRFMKCKGTTAIFIVTQMQENFRAKGKKLYFGFVDLEKNF